MNCEAIQVQLPEGPRNFEKKQLYLKAIKMDKVLAEAHDNLGRLGRLMAPRFYFVKQLHKKWKQLKQ